MENEKILWRVSDGKKTVREIRAESLDEAAEIFKKETGKNGIMFQAFVKNLR